MTAFDDVIAEHEQLQEDVETLTNERDELDQRLTQCRDEYESERGVLQGEIDELRDMLEKERQAAAENIDSVESMLHEDLAACRTALEAEQRLTGDVMRERRLHVEEVADLTKQLRDAKSTLADQVAFSDCRRKLSAARAHIADCETTATHHLQERDQAQSKLKAAEDLLQDWSSRYDAEFGRRPMPGSDLAHARRLQERDNAVSELKVVGGELDRLRAENKRLELASLRAAALANRLVQLIAELYGATDEIANTAQELTP